MLTELIRRADVLMENFRPGTLTRLGFGTDVLAELNPRLVTLSISGFGHDGLSMFTSDGSITRALPTALAAAMLSCCAK